MKTYLINLARRADRLEAFGRANAAYLNGYEVEPAFDGRACDYVRLQALGYDTDKSYRDPCDISGRVHIRACLGRVQTRGEIGCFISHYRLWERCADGNEEFLVLEDDAVFSAHIDDVLSAAPAFDLLYLCHQEMMPEGVIDLGAGFNKPCYPWTTVAYVLTPKAARELVNTDITQSIIPADEYLPRMLDRFHAVAFDTPPVLPRSRDDGGTDVNATCEADYIRDFKLHVLTCCSEPGMLEFVRESMATNIALDPGCEVQGQKVQEVDVLALLRLYIENHKLQDSDVILAVDAAYDITHVRGTDEVLGRYLSFHREVVLSAMTFPFVNCFLSGTFIGRVGELRRILGGPIVDAADYKVFLKQAYESGRYEISLDEGYIFKLDELLGPRQREAQPFWATGCWCWNACLPFTGPRQ